MGIFRFQGFQEIFRFIRGCVVDDNDFIIPVILFQDGGKVAAQGFGFVACRDDDRHWWLFLLRVVGLLHGFLLLRQSGHRTICAHGKEMCRPRQRETGVGSIRQAQICHGLNHPAKSSVTYPLGSSRQLYDEAMISPYAPAERRARKSPRWQRFRSKAFTNTSLDSQMGPTTS